MSFTNAQKVDIRRFCGYPAYGAGPSGFQSWRFFQAYGTLEYRLNNLAPEEEAVITATYLANLYTLESAIPTASGNLDTDRAGPWTHNRGETGDREALFANWRHKLCEFLGVPAGPALGASSSTRRLIL
jgi:hypothetical protein